MNEIIIHTQQEFDALPKSFDEYTRIIIRDTKETIVLNRARDNSSVLARGNSSVLAWGNSSVLARDNSSVVAWGNVGVHLQSDYVMVSLFAFSVCWKLAKGKIEKKSKTATVIEPIYEGGVSGWFERNGVEKNDGKVVLFKRVSKDFLTQENTDNETHWEVGKIITHKNWKPSKSECGEGKFHACPTAYLCDEFRSEKDDKYVAIEIKQDDLFVWEDNPEYPYKIAFREGKVLYECNKFGKKI